MLLKSLRKCLPTASHSFFLAQKDRYVATKTQPRDTQDPIQRQHIRSNLMLGTLENRQRGWPLATAATGGDCSVKAYLAGPRLDENCWAVRLLSFPNKNSYNLYIRYIRSQMFFPSSLGLL